MRTNTAVADAGVAALARARERDGSALPRDVSDFAAVAVPVPTRSAYLESSTVRKEDVARRLLK